MNHIVPTRETNDPNIAIESIENEGLETQRITYLDSTTGERWVEIGRCNQCGLCVAGDDPDIEWNPVIPVGEPMACRDRLYAIRPHYVTRPSILKLYPQCSLSFEVDE